MCGTLKLLCLLGVFCMVPVVGSDSIPRTSVCKPHLSESWYPHDPRVLRQHLEGMYKKAGLEYDAQVDGQAISAAVVPHAGYSYSGVIAASVYRLLAKTSKKRVVILAPSHTASFVGCAVPTCTDYLTPLGSLACDMPAVAALAKSSYCKYDDSVFSQEHSIEVQLPFIRYSLPSCVIVPVIVGSMTQAQVQEVASVLSSIIDDTTLVIVSSDFIHYGRRFGYEPFKDILEGPAEAIRDRDFQAVRLIQEYELQKFMKFIDRTGATICGHVPLALLIALINTQVFGKVSSQLISYASSDQVSDDSTGRVSYCGLVFTRLPARGNNIPVLNANEKKVLTNCARSALEQSFAQELPVLKSHYGVFVTLKKAGQLRGCIGTFATDKPLYKTVGDMALAAAFHDTRFKPLTYQEFAECTITISVLSNPRPIKSYQEIILGTHGIILHQGKKHAVFLPEVPGEFGWDLPTTLKELSIKAGLPADAWRNKTTTFEIFESLEWSE